MKTRYVAVLLLAFALGACASLALRPASPVPTPAPAGPAVTPAPTIVPTPAPLPAPPTGDVCPFPPCPQREWTVATLPPGWDPALVGKPRWHFNVHPYPPSLIDSTPVVDRDLAYCQAVGYNDGRDSCPMRLDGHPERVAVEAYVCYGQCKVEGRYPETASSCASTNGNPMQFRALGNCRICSAHDEVCSPWQ
jgi:hypothetical protein